jgi:4-hydroxybenzoate polyprenyltransferase
LKALVNLVRLSRPSHWLKNGFVLAALVFARKVTDADAVLKTLEAFAAFCLASSAVYVLNDVVDRREDAQHPSKRNRPVASGAVGVGTAVALGFVLAAGAVAMASHVGGAFAATSVRDQPYIFLKNGSCRARPGSASSEGGATGQPNG